FFDVLGLPPSQGRNFTREEGSDKAANVVISDDFWRSTLNSRRDVLGNTIVIDGTPRTIIGVMPKAFRHPYRASLWLPLALEPDDPTTLNNHYLYAVARLRPGVTPLKAEKAVKRMSANINRDDPNPANARAAYIPPLRESFVMDLRPKILVIVGAAVCALLIAAANFAGLLLARVIEREGEFALRAALGASRRRLVRQQLTQALLLAFIGTALGLLIAFWITPMLFALSPEGADATGSAMREFDYAARLDLPVFAFAAGVMTLVGLGFGLLPAVRAARTDLRGAMSVTSRGATLDRSARSESRHRCVAVANGRAVDTDAVQRRGGARTGAARGLHRLLAPARPRLFPKRRSADPAGPRFQRERHWRRAARLHCQPKHRE